MHPSTRVYKKPKSLLSTEHLPREKNDVPVPHKKSTDNSINGRDVRVASRTPQACKAVGFTSFFWQPRRFVPVGRGLDSLEVCVRFGRAVDQNDGVMVHRSVHVRRDLFHTAPPPHCLSHVGTHPHQVVAATVASLIRGGNRSRNLSVCQPHAEVFLGKYACRNVGGAFQFQQGFQLGQFLANQGSRRPAWGKEIKFGFVKSRKSVRGSLTFASHGFSSRLRPCLPHVCLGKGCHELRRILGRYGRRQYRAGKLPRPEEAGKSANEALSGKMPIRSCRATCMKVRGHVQQGHHGRPTEPKSLFRSSVHLGVEVQAKPLAQLIHRLQLLLRHATWLEKYAAGLTKKHENIEELVGNSFG